MTQKQEELAQRICEDRRTGSLEFCLQQFRREEHRIILGNLELMKCDVRKYGWQYLEYLNTFKENGYWVRPLQDLYLMEAELKMIQSS